MAPAAFASEPVIWSGQTQWRGVPIAFELLDRDGNRRAGDPSDRLRLDLDADGELHPLTEQFACKSILRIDGQRVTLGLEPIVDDPKPSTGYVEQAIAPEHARSEHLTGYHVTLEPLHGTGFVTIQAHAIDEAASLEEISATLVSQGGIHISIDQIDSAVEVPVGTYRVDRLTLRSKDERHWRMVFAKTRSPAQQTVSITDGQSVKFDVLGKLTLDAHLAAAVGSTQMSVAPSLTTSTGLYLVDSDVGRSQPQDENSLTASLVDLKSADDPKVIAISSTGFACGTFCPITFNDLSPLTPTHAVWMQFDAGPLGGPMVSIVKPGEAGKSLADDVSKRDSLN